MTAKALRFATFLRSNNATEIPSALALLAEHDGFAEQAEASWKRITEMVAEVSGIDETVPSAATRAAIATLCQSLPPVDADPFAGLGEF